MERMNGEIRGREKVMRGLKRSDTPILLGYQIYHNCIRPHSALGGRTPADACGIAIVGETKRLTLIQNAAHSENTQDVENVPNVDTADESAGDDSPEHLLSSAHGSREKAPIDNHVQSVNKLQNYSEESRGLRS
jgi:hypothetical protein